MECLSLETLQRKGVTQVTHQPLFGSAVPEGSRIHQDCSWKVKCSSVPRARIAADVAPGAVLLCSRQLSRGVGCAELGLGQVSAGALWLSALKVEVASQGSCPSRDRDT